MMLPNKRICQLIRGVNKVKIRVLFLSLLLAVSLLSSLSYAGALLNVQGKVTDTGGQLLTGPHDLYFNLYKTETSTVPIWSEAHPAVEIKEGLFNVVLGKYTVLDLPFNAQYYLSTAVDGMQEMSPRQLLGSTPYALGSLGDFAVSGNIKADGIIIKGVPLEISGGQVSGTEITGSVNNGSLYAPTSGNVGIGTATPQAMLQVGSGHYNVQSSPKLMVSGDVSAPGITDLVSINVGGAGVPAEFGGRLLFQNYDVKSAGIAGIRSGGGPGDLAFYTQSWTAGTDDFTEKMRITSNGNVGIGTASPTGILHVQPEAASAGANGKSINLYAQGGGTGNTNGGDVVILAGAKSGSGSRGTIIFGQDPTYPHGIQIGRNGNFYSLSLNGDTSMHIHTPDANRSLILQDVRGAGNGQGLETGVQISPNYIDLNTAGDGYTALLVNVGDAQAGATGNKFIQDWQVNGASKMVITNTGNVGIGTATPAYKLDVAGTINAQEVMVNGAPLAGGSNQWSNLTAPTAGVYYTAGNVGIGTTNPQVPLAVAAGGQAGIGHTTTDYVPSVSGSGVFTALGADTGNTYGEIRALSGGGGTWDSLILQKGGGRVGIGTATPAYKLDVAGTINARQVLVNGAPLAGGSNQWSNLTAPTAGVYYTAGNVGIGTTTPGYKLDVNGTGRFTEGISVIDGYSNLTFLGNTPSIKGGYSLLLQGNANPDNPRLFLDGSGSSTNNSLSIGSNTNPYQMYINTAIGNVGIGTMTPTRKLSFGTGQSSIGTDDQGVNTNAGGMLFINSGSGGTGTTGGAGGNLRLEAGYAGGSGNNDGGDVFLTPGNATGLGTRGRVVIDSARGPGSDGGLGFNSTLRFRSHGQANWDIVNDGSLNFIYNPNPAGTTNVVFKSNGSVGIGTPSPGRKLHINAGGNPSDGIRLETSVTDGANIEWRTGEGTHWNIDNYTGGLLRFFTEADDETGGVVRMAINSTTGNVGIGTASPAAKLDVVGDIVGTAQVFRAYMTSDFSKAATWEKIPFNATVFNTLQGTFDTTNNRFTASRAGYYQISVTGYSSTAGTGSERYAIGVYKNGANEGFAGSNYSALDTPLAGPSMIVYLNGSTDYVEIWMFSAIAATLRGGSSGGHTMFWHMNYLGR